jgi:Arc/MetJ-type ribon-helix-helix transcriptional regulator
MVYSDTMGRTQIYLNDEELALLERAERATGASRSELIRRAVRSAYGEMDKDERLKALGEAKGIWRDRPFTGAEYVDAIRTGWNDRLRRLHGE